MFFSVEVSNSPGLSSPSSLSCSKGLYPAETLACNKRSSSPTLSLSPCPSVQTSRRKQHSNLISYSPIPTLVKAEPSKLKRKKPTKLDIPSVTPYGLIPQPSTQKTVVEEGSDYWVYCQRGRREAMEDRFSASISTYGEVEQAIFGVFDGHGGARAAEFAAQNLHHNILKEVNSSGRETVEAIKQGYLKTDNDFLMEDTHGGSCCVTAFISEGNLIASNAGDCRAVMSSGGVAEPLTNDHRPCREDEKARIEALGGHVDSIHGAWRVQGSLGVSRAIGNGYLKQWVTAEPQSKVVKLQPNHELLILASDGLWDKVTNQEAVDICRPLMMFEQAPLKACMNMANLAVTRGSLDDITVMVIRLKPFHALKQRSGFNAVKNHN